MAKTHTCEICGKNFIKPKPLSPSRFCSRACWYEYQRSDVAKKISREKMEETRKKYIEKHGKPLGFTSINNPSYTPSARQRMSQFRKGVPLSEETRRKQSESLKKTIERPEIRAKWVAAATGRILDLESRKKISAAHKGKGTSRQGIINSIDKVYSRYIREKESANGKCVCITCDRVSDINNIDCGHYISRRFLALRFDERNTHPQCISCNRFQQGNIDVYTIKMIAMYGPEILTELNQIKNSGTKISTPELKEELEYYRKKLSELNPNKYPLWL